MDNNLNSKDIDILLGLIRATTGTLLEGAALATPAQRAEIPEAVANLQSVKRKLERMRRQLGAGQALTAKPHVHATYVCVTHGSVLAGCSHRVEKTEIKTRCRKNCPGRTPK